MLAGSGEVGDGFMRQHLHRAPVLDRARIVATAAGAQMGNLVQRGIDVQQCTGNIQQQVLVNLLATFDHAAQRIALLHDHAAPRPTPPSCQRHASVSATAPSSLAWGLFRRTTGAQVRSSAS